MKVSTTKGLKTVESTGVDRPDVQKGADALIEALRQWAQRTEGKALSDDEVLAEATEAIRKRL